MFIAHHEGRGLGNTPAGVKPTSVGSRQRGGPEPVTAYGDNPLGCGAFVGGKHGAKGLAAMLDSGAGEYSVNNRRWNHIAINILSGHS